MLQYKIKINSCKNIIRKSLLSQGSTGEDWEFGISICKLLYIEWINNKVLLCGSGHYIQYLLINILEEYEKNVYICVTESLSCIVEIDTTL